MIAYDPSYDDEDTYWAIDRLRRPGESWDECDARLRREAEEERRSDICMYEWEL